MKDNNILIKKKIIGTDIGIDNNNDRESEHISSADRDYFIRYREGYENGIKEGKIEGYDSGQEYGYEAGYQAGENEEEYDDIPERVNYDSSGLNENSETYDKGYHDGYTLGYEPSYTIYYFEGYKIGYKDGYEDGGKGVAFASEPIDLRNVFVYGSDSGCRDYSHTDKELVRATIPIIRRFGTVDNIEFDAVFCRECGVYYISRSEYERLSEKGRLLCQLMTETEYRKYSESYKPGYPSEESKLHAFGYNVGEKDGYTDAYRQHILEAAIASGVVTKKKAIGHLEYLINLNEKKYNYRYAIEKWRKDLAYLKGFDPDLYIQQKRLIAVKKIIKTVY